MTDRKKLTANALRDMADRIERGEVYAKTMNSFIEIMYPRITKDDGFGNIEIGVSPSASWTGMVTVQLPDGVLTDEELAKSRYGA